MNLLSSYAIISEVDEKLYCHPIVPLGGNQLLNITTLFFWGEALSLTGYTLGTNAFHHKIDILQAEIWG